MKRKFTPPPAAFLIALLLAGSVGVASAASAAPPSSGSWFHTMVQEVECAIGNQSACMALKDAGSGMASTDGGGETVPNIKNN